MITAMQTERRRERRVRAVDLVRVEECGDLMDGYACLGRTRDLSHDGLCVELDHPIDIGARVQVDLQLGEAILALEGRVRSVRETRRAGHVTGHLRAEGYTEWGHGLAGGAVAALPAWDIGVELRDVTPEQYEALDLYLHLRGD